MARKSKELVKEKGILSTPNPKPGSSLPQETTELVTQFYESDDISRVMPGKKDFVSVRKEGRRVHVQKRLMVVLAVELRELPTYHHYIAKILCNPPLPGCYLSDYSICLGVAILKDHLTTCLRQVVR